MSDNNNNNNNNDSSSSSLEEPPEEGRKRNRATWEAPVQPPPPSRPNHHHHHQPPQADGVPPSGPSRRSSSTFDDDDEEQDDNDNEAEEDGRRRQRQRPRLSNVPKQAAGRVAVLQHHGRNVEQEVERDATIHPNEGGVEQDAAPFVAEAAAAAAAAVVEPSTATGIRQDAQPPSLLQGGGGGIVRERNGDGHLRLSAFTATDTTASNDRNRSLSQVAARPANHNPLLVGRRLNDNDNAPPEQSSRQFSDNGNVDALIPLANNLDDLPVARPIFPNQDAVDHSDDDSSSGHSSAAVALPHRLPRDPPPVAFAVPMDPTIMEAVTGRHGQNVLPMADRISELAVVRAEYLAEHIEHLRGFLDQQTEMLEQLLVIFYRESFRKLNTEDFAQAANRTIFLALIGCLALSVALLVKFFVVYNTHPCDVLEYWTPSVLLPNKEPEQCSSLHGYLHCYLHDYLSYAMGGFNVTDGVMGEIESPLYKEPRACITAMVFVFAAIAACCFVLSKLPLLAKIVVHSLVAICISVSLFMHPAFKLFAVGLLLVNVTPWVVLVILYILMTKAIDGTECPGEMEKARSNFKLHMDEKVCFCPLLVAVLVFLVPFS